MGETLPVSRYQRWSDEDLALAFRAGDQAAGEALLQRYSRFVYALAARFGRGSDESDDIFVEVWIKLQDQIANYEQRAGFRAYLRALVRSVVIDHYRRGRPAGEVLSLDAGAGATADEPPLGDQLADEANLELELQETELRDLVQRAIELLPERFRIPVELYYRHELSHEAIAERLGCPKNTVTTRIHRGREQIRRQVTRWLGE